MNIEKERELFLYELTDSGFVVKNKTWCDDWNRFEDGHVGMAWEMWLASRNRNGYVLIPAEPTKDIIYSMEEFDCHNDYADMESAYKAAIGVINE